jgi:hypothetical protein
MRSGIGTFNHEGHEGQSTKDTKVAKPSQENFVIFVSSW